MATIKIATQGDLPRFVDGGITAQRGWTDLDLDSLTDEGRATLSQYVGRFIRVHDESQSAFESYLAAHGMSWDKDAGRVKDPAREERERQQREADEQARTARGTSPGTAAVEGQRNFQSPTGTSARTVDAEGGGGTRDVVTRDRTGADTSPDKPSTKRPPGR